MDNLVSNEAKWYHNKFGMDRLERKRADIEAKSGDESSAKRVCPRRQSLDKNVCIFCEDASGRLHQFSTHQSDTSLRSMAIDLQDASLLAKIEGGDLAKYHLSCLAKLRNRHRSYVRESQNASRESLEERKMEARAFVELLRVRLKKVISFLSFLKCDFSMKFLRLSCSTAKQSHQRPHLIITLKNLNHHYLCSLGLNLYKGT